MNAKLPAIFKKSLIYGSKSLLGALVCWYGLALTGMPDPVWAVITVIIVSDPDFQTTKMLARTRAINTAVGCMFGITSLLLFGYSPLLMLLTAAVTVMLVTLIEKYPLNWRLAPVTVVIVMDAGRQATDHHEEMLFASMRMIQIGVGCAVALALAALYTYWTTHRVAVKKDEGAAD